MDWCHERPRVFLEASSFALKFSKTSETDRGVVGWYGANDTMLRRSAQLFLAPENDHFEGSMLLKMKEGIIKTLEQNSRSLKNREVSRDTSP